MGVSQIILELAQPNIISVQGHRGCDHMVPVVGFTTTYAISAYHH
jgi:hypothetical protein